MKLDLSLSASDEFRTGQPPRLYSESVNAEPRNAPLTSVFVYGTLMPGERNAHVARRGGQFTSRPARLAGFRLFHLHPEHYPGLTPATPADIVQGSVLTYSAADWDKALPFLDALEGVHETPPLYTREKVQVQYEDGQRADTWVYVYARPQRLQASGVQFIKSGDWREANERDRRTDDNR